MNRSVVLLLLAASCLGSAPAAAQEARLAGDARAVEAVERMLKRLGGRAVWARARTLYLEYDGWRLRPNEPVIERAWRDLREPYQRAEYEGRTFYVVYGLSPQQSWVSRNGRVTLVDAAEHATTLEEYPYDFYAIIHNLAAADSRLRLEWREPNRVMVKTADGRERCWWIIDSTGAPIKWGAPASGGNPPLEYIYGPVRQFGNINFPAWGSSMDGGWRWTYLKVDVSTEPLSVSVTPPKDND